jgi:N,N'-diacetyllegionaminate synthase
MTSILVDIGINHMGNMNIARKLIGDAAEVGATIAKFQWYSCDALFGDPTKDTYNRAIYDTVKPFELDEAKVTQLMKWCELEGIEFGCSVFDQERFEKLDAMGVKHHKIASRVSKFDRGLAETILATGKPTYTSLGFGAEPFDQNKYPNCLPLYCIASYPTENHEIHLPKSFKDSGYYGFSSHAMSPVPAMMAIARGAKAIEVHFTLSKSMAAMTGGFDHLCSLDKSELKQLVDFSKQVYKVIPYCE